MKIPAPPPRRLPGHPPSPCTPVDFVKDVQPILETNCVRCHNPKGTEFEKGDTDLNLSTKETAFESKSTIVARQCGEEQTLQRPPWLPDDAKKLMPPRNKVTNDLERLAKADADILKDWIKRRGQLAPTA